MRWVALINHYKVLLSYVVVCTIVHILFCMSIDMGFATSINIPPTMIYEFLDFLCQQINVVFEM